MSENDTDKRLEIAGRRDAFSIFGGIVPSFDHDRLPGPHTPFVIHSSYPGPLTALDSVKEETDLERVDENDEASSEIADGSGRIAHPDQSKQNGEDAEALPRENVEPEEIQQPIPFQM